MANVCCWCIEMQSRKHLSNCLALLIILRICELFVLFHFMWTIILSVLNDNYISPFPIIHTWMSFSPVKAEVSPFHSLSPCASLSYKFFSVLKLNSKEGPSRYVSLPVCPFMFS